MKVSYNWLKDLVPFDHKPEELAEVLTLAGFEIDAIDAITLDYAGLVVGEVLERIKHPDADKLSVCTVSVGGAEPLQIVCGAPNVAKGQKVPVATVGTELPGGFNIRKAKIRGQHSFGMICSEAELGLSDNADGIWVLPGTVTVGEPVAKALGFETDYVLDVSITPNRPDALSHYGIAREIAAITGNALNNPEIRVPESAEKAADHIKVTIETPAGCPRYAARLIRGISRGSSPDWMARRLRAVGMRPISLAVDITNYVLLELGHPLHAFDYHLVKDGHIVVREAAKGESIVTLDGKTRKLSEGTVLICDAEKPVAIGGIMGGDNSEINDNTVDILLESAYFAPDYIRRSLRHLGMFSEASQRFERGADPNNVMKAMNRACQLFAELAGGQVAAGVVDAYPVEIRPKHITLDPDYVNRLLGTTLSQAEMVALLGKLNIPVANGEVIVPTYRPDMEQEADVAEEVARMLGYDNIPLKVVSPLPYSNNFDPFDDFLEAIRQSLSGIGIQEIVTNSMINKESWGEITGAEIYPIMNPISGDMNGMRNSLVPSLLTALRWNVNRQVRDLKMF
nr:phenylalanine--tRNA ligase subunit beta [Calditrichia bacterium]